ncbi:MAG: DUF2000 family protein [Candidatus Thiodiazotropha sp. (ex Lucinoma borealis)]|nr:DUF2000 family protein [Candidatus Thiodiazotropha sp. (ex Lucinoma borealis)]
MKRIAVILDKGLSRGEACNIAAIVVGQLSATNHDVYSQQSITDLDGIQHAGINFSTIVLQASSPTQLANFAKKISADCDHVNLVAFSRSGQQLNNQPDQHRSEISTKRLHEVEPLGLAIFGDDQQVRQLTKRFSVFR